jgi:TRAP-type C4-dicarboxylate transport system substrate-binding protein
MKRLILILFIGLSTISLLSVQSSLAKDPIKPVKLKVAVVYPPPNVSMISEVMKTWQDEVTKRTKGAITFQNFWGAALGPPMEHLHLLKSGAVDIAQFIEWYNPGQLPLGDFEYVFPFGPTDYEITAKANRKIISEFPEFARDLKRQNAVKISDPPGGVYQFLSKKPLRGIADFNGEKVSLIGRYFGRWLPPGSIAVVRPAPERYEMLRRGVVDVDLLPFDLLYGFKIHEQTKYAIIADLITCMWGPILMNAKTYNKFSPATQKMFLELGEKMELRAAREIIPRWWKRVEREWKQMGIQFIQFPEEEKKKWVASIPDTALEWAEEVEGKGYPGHKIVKRWQDITADLGYKWPRHWGKLK